MSQTPQECMQAAMVLDRRAVLSVVSALRKYRAAVNAFMTAQNLSALEALERAVKDAEEDLTE